MSTFFLKKSQKNRPPKGPILISYITKVILAKANVT